MLRSRLTLGAPTGEPARIYVDSRRTIGPLHRTVFGSFLEHLGRAIYDGIFEPGSPLADAQGFRTDVLSVVRALDDEGLRVAFAARILSAAAAAAAALDAKAIDDAFDALAGVNSWPLGCGLFPK